MPFLMRTLICLSLIISAGVLPYPATENQWIEVRSPNFVVISDASAKQAKRTARSLEQFRSLLRTAFPKLKLDPACPLIVFALKDERSFKALSPNDDKEAGTAQSAGLFLGSPERNFVLLRTDLPPEQAYHVVYHEFVHLVMRLNFPQLPLWLSEGLAELFGNANISGKWSTLGTPPAEMLRVLQTKQMIPLSTLMSVTADSPYYHKQGMVEMFYAQSWALTHYLLLGERQAHSGQLSRFLTLLQNDIPEEEAIKQAFGNLKTLEHNLNRYVRLRSFYHYQIPADEGIKEDRFAVRVLSHGESLAARGQVLLHSDRLDEAKSMFEQALQLDPHSSLAHEGMGLFFMMRKNRELAEKYFTAAVELDSRSFLAHYFAALPAYERGDQPRAEAYLRKSLAINPWFVPACKTLSQLLMAQQEKLAEALELSKRAAELEPAEFSHRLDTGKILIMMGRLDEAYTLTEKLLAAARTEAERTAAESLLFSIKHRKDAVRGRNGSSHQALKETYPPAEDEKSDQGVQSSPVKTGHYVKAKGLIRSVKCDYPAIMDVELDSNGTVYKLRAENYYQVRYWAVGAPGKSGFEPCEELEGKNVEVEFLTVFGQEYSGFLKTVAIQK